MVGFGRLIRRVWRRKVSENDAKKEGEGERGVVARVARWLFRNGWAVAYSVSFWTASSLLTFGANAFNNALTRARFNREMEKVKKSIETNMNKRFAVIVASKGETAEWLNRLLNELWGNVVIPVLDAQVPAMLEQAFKDQLKPPDGSPSTLPSFIKDLRLIEFKLGNAPPKVGTIGVPEGQQDGKLPDGDLVLETAYSFDSDDLNVAVLLVISKRDRSLKDLKDVHAVNTGMHHHRGILDDGSTGIVVKVDKIKFHACLRYRVRPNAQMVFIGLNEVPRIELDLTATLKTVGGISIPIKLTRLPGVKKALESIIQGQLVKFVVWPRYVPFKLVPTAGVPDTVVQDNNRPSTAHQVSKFSQVDRRLRPPNGGTLIVTVIEARNLRALHRSVSKARKRVLKGLRDRVGKATSMGHENDARTDAIHSFGATASDASSSSFVDDNNSLNSDDADGLDQIGVDFDDERPGSLDSNDTWPMNDRSDTALSPSGINTDSPRTSAASSQASPARHIEAKFKFQPVVTLTSGSSSATSSAGRQAGESNPVSYRETFTWGAQSESDDGCADDDNCGEVLEVDSNGTVFSVEISVRNGAIFTPLSGIGEALIQVEWLKNGDTVFHSANEEGIPVMYRSRMARSQSSFGSRTSQPGECEIWIPLERVLPSGRRTYSGTGGAQLRCKLEMEWSYTKKMDASTVFETGMSYISESSIAETILERKAAVIQRAIRKYLDAAADNRARSLAERHGMRSFSVISVSILEAIQPITPRRIALSGSMRSHVIVKLTYNGRTITQSAKIVDRDGLRLMKFPRMFEWEAESTSSGPATTDQIVVDFGLSSRASFPGVSTSFASLGRTAIDIGDIEEGLCRHDYIIVKASSEALGNMEVKLRVARLNEYRMRAPDSHQQRVDS